MLTENTEFEGVALIKTSGQHGTDAAYAVIGEILGNVCGVVFKHKQEKTLYLAGDTIWNEYVEDNLRTYQPDVVILNCGDAQVPGLGSIIMGKEDVRKVYDAAPQAMLVASHMEAVSPCLLSRQELREFSGANGMTDRLLVPNDGEAVRF